MSHEFKLCHVARSTPQRNLSHKRVLKASIRGSQRLAWDECTYYGDSLNQQICKLQIPHRTMTICGNDQGSNKGVWVLLNIPRYALCTHFLANAGTHPPATLTIFSLSFASSPGASSPVPVCRRPEEVTVLAVAPVGALLLLGLMCGGRGRRGARPPVSPVRRSPAGFAFLAEAFLWLMALQSIHHFNGHLY